MSLHRALASYIRPILLVSLVRTCTLSLNLVLSTNQSAMPIQERGIARFTAAHQQREGGGFLVRRPIGGEIRECDPFLMLDHLGPVVYGPGEAVGAPDHPHRGFETVSYIIEGGMQHKDSAGNSGTLAPGWVQWMTAGSGVVHSEMPSDEVLEKGGKSEGFQLWVNLPKKDKMIPPRYQDTPPEKIPVATTDDGQVTVKVIAGESLGQNAYIETRTKILFLDIRLQPGATFVQPVPSSYDGFAYVWRGSGHLGPDAGSKSAVMGDVAVLGSGDSFRLKAEDSQSMYVLLIAGEPIREPIARHGPFVMNTQAEIRQAFHDYQTGKLGSIDGSEERYAKTVAAKQKQQSTGRWQKDQGDL
eukprot:scpid52960/ scgid2778/ Pirin-like protein